MTLEKSTPFWGTYRDGIRDFFSEQHNARLLGFSLYWAWLLSSAILFSEGTFVGGLMAGLPLSVGMYLARGLALIVVVVLSRKRSAKQIIYLAEKVGASAGPIGFAFLLIASGVDGPIKLVCMLASWVLMGIADGLLVVAWLCVYRSTDLHSAIYAFFCSMLLAVGLMVLVGYVAMPLDTILVLLMPVGCAWGLHRVKDLPKEMPDGKDECVQEDLLTASASSVSTPSASSAPKSLKGLYGAIAVSGIVFGGMQVIIYNYNNTAIPFTLRCLGICFGSVLALLLSVLPESTRGVIIYRFALPLMACGLLLVPLAGDDLFFSAVLVNTGFFLFDFISICMLLRATVLYQLSTPSVMAWGRCANALGIFFGWIAGHLLASAFNFGLADISAWSSILLLAIIMACGSLLSTPGADGELMVPIAEASVLDVVEDAVVPHAQQSQPGRWSRQCDLVASKYGLSPREQEVLKLLSRGRDAEYIAALFVISPHTAKTHIHNVYKKLDIHSQQDLISMVEDAADELVGKE